MITFLIITIYGTVSEGGMARLTDQQLFYFRYHFQLVVFLVHVDQCCVFYHICPLFVLTTFSLSKTLNPTVL